jgi:hypothetical protein
VVGTSLHDSGKLVSFETRARGGGIWSPGGPSVVGNDIYFATGNTFGAQTWSDGEAVFRVGADLRRSEDNRMRSAMQVSARTSLSSSSI